MFDCHCHIIPGIDDGASNLAQSLEMAKIAASEGISVIACTPHITPGVYDNTTHNISEALVRLQKSILDNGIPIRLVIGADVHISPGIIHGVNARNIPTLDSSRYLLLEFSHHQMTPHLEQLAFEILSAGYIPVLTHPERLSWIEDGFSLFKTLAERGCWLQITSGAIIGKFGRKPQYWATHFLSEGLTHVIATDAHDPKRRPPIIQAAIARVTELVGAAETRRIIFDRPNAILEDSDSTLVDKPIGLSKALLANSDNKNQKKPNLFYRISRRWKQNP